MIDLFGVRITGEPREERAEAVLSWDLLNFEPKAIDFAVVPASVGEPLFKAGHVYQLYGVLAATERQQ
jgi:hypothetical protein